MSTVAFKSIYRIEAENGKRMKQKQPPPPPQDYSGTKLISLYNVFLNKIGIFKIIFIFSELYRILNIITKGPVYS